MKISNKRLNGILIVTVFSGLCYTDALAESIAPGRPIAFETFDLDGNNKVSPEEFTAVREKRRAKAEGRRMAGAANAPGFGDIDRDDDGQLTRAELLDHHRTRMADRGNSTVELGRWQTKSPGRGMATSKPLFTDIDVDADGKISKEEFDKHQDTFADN